MSASAATDTARRLRVALDLYAAGVSLMRARLRRLHPYADEQEVDQRLAEWLRTRPGAPWGDTVGAPREA